MNQAEKMKKITRKRSFWTEEKENIFIEMWEEKIDEIRGKRKNSHIYKEMATELAKNGVNISPDEVKAKITNLTSKYRKCKLSIGPSGGSPSNWPLYERVNRIIGSQPINNLNVIVEDSITDSQIDDILMDDISPEYITSDRSQSLASPSNVSVSSTPPSADKPSSSRGAKNKKLMDMFDKFGKSIEKVIEEDKKCTQELLALEKEKLKIFKDMRDSTLKLTDGILGFLNKK